MVTLGVRSSAYEFWRDTFHSVTVAIITFLAYRNDSEFVIG